LLGKLKLNRIQNALENIPPPKPESPAK